MKLSVVIPCYNEARNLPLLVERCRQVIAADGDVDFVLVDNGSGDDSPQVLASLLADQDRISSLRVPVNQGYGYGILSGLAAAKGDILAWTHADMQTDPMDVLKALALFRAQPDPRNLFVSGLRHGRPLGDKIFTWGMSAFESLLLRAPLRDINGQPKMFHQDFHQSLQNPPQDFALDLFYYAMAAKRGLAVKRIAVTFGERAFGVSHWNVNWRSKLKLIRRTVDFSLSLRRKFAP